jgi:hypothetical protein
VASGDPTAVVTNILGAAFEPTAHDSSTGVYTLTTTSSLVGCALVGTVNAGADITTINATATSSTQVEVQIYAGVTFADLAAEDEPFSLQVTCSS